MWWLLGAEARGPLNAAGSIARARGGGRRVQRGPQQHTIRNVLVDIMKAEKLALVPGDGNEILDFLSRHRGSRLTNAYNQAGDRAYITR